MLLLHRRFATNMAFAPWHDEFTPDARGRYLTFPAGSRNRRFSKNELLQGPQSREIQFPTGAASLRPEGLEIGSRRPDRDWDMTASPTSVRWLGCKPAKPARGRKLGLVAGSPASPSISTSEILPSSGPTRQAAFLWENDLARNRSNKSLFSNHFGPKFPMLSRRPGFRSGSVCELSYISYRAIADFTPHSAPRHFLAIRP